MNYSDYLKGKNVAIVGPAPTVIEVQNNIEKINACDIIVRLNKSLPIAENLKNKIGNKTHILYNCLEENPESGGYLHIPYLAQQVEWVISSYPPKSPFKQNIDKFKSRNCDRINFDTFDLEYYNKIEAEMKTRPNTGVLAILDLLSKDIKSLYITGFTFFKGGYLKEYREYNEPQILAIMKIHGNHEQEPQIEYMKKVLTSDKRVKMDKFLREIING